MPGRPAVKHWRLPLPRLSGGRQAKGDSSRFTFQNNHAFYLQDTFQARRGVSLNWGLRWDYYGVIGADNNRFSVFDTSAAAVTPVSQLYDRDMNNFSPRVSAAWDLTGEGKLESVEGTPGIRVAHNVDVKVSNFKVEKQ